MRWLSCLAVFGLVLASVAASASAEGSDGLGSAVGSGVDAAVAVGIDAGGDIGAAERPWTPCPENCGGDCVTGCSTPPAGRVAARGLLVLAIVAGISALRSRRVRRAPPTETTDDL